jgi:hypothetical protein
MYGKSVGGSQFIVGLQESEISADKSIFVVRNPKFSEEVPALSNIGISVVVWSDHRCDGIIFRGHPKYMSGEAWNDWAIIKWQITE